MKPYLLLLNCFYDKGRVGKSQEQFIKPSIPYFSGTAALANECFLKIGICGFFRIMS